MALTWISGSGFTPRSNFGAAYTTGKTYIVGGSVYGGTTADVRAYDLTTNLWSSKAPITAARTYFACAAGDDGKIYVFSGLDSVGTPSTTTYVYTPGTNLWSTGSSMLTARPRATAVNITGTNLIYVLGGYVAGAASNIVQDYDTSSSTFHSHNIMSTARYGLGVVYLNGYIYAIGGQGTTVLKTVEAYNITTGVWTTKADLPVALSGAFCFTYDDKIYVAGGYTAGTISDAIYVYDPVADTWTTSSDTMTIGRAYGCTVSTSSRAYLLGGYNSFAVRTGANEQLALGITINSTAFIGLPSISSTTTIRKPATQTISSNTNIKQTGYAYVVSPGSVLPGLTRITADVFGSPIATIQSNANITIYSNSSQTTVVDTITASIDPLYVLDLASVSPPFGYQNYDWAYDWVVRTYNGAVCKFEARSADNLVTLNIQPFTSIAQGQIIPRADIHRYHQYKAHVWASGSGDFELHQFTIKAYVDYPAYPYTRTLTPQIKTSISSITLGTPVDQPDIIL